MYDQLIITAALLAMLIIYMDDIVKAMITLLILAVEFAVHVIIKIMTLIYLIGKFIYLAYFDKGARND
jgi:hypothetical protein